MRDGSGWVHCRAARLTLGVIFVCVNVGACAALITSSVWGSWRRHHRGLPQTPSLLRAACLFVLCVWTDALVVCKLCLKNEDHPWL